MYGIGILPLGGYVKMLGQDDDPAHIAEQMQKSQIDANSTNAKAIKGPNGETYYVDRRSYLAKSVPQRMAIISAGVIMNIIFAFIFAVIAYGMGVKYVPSIVGGTMPGSPAWMAELETGDEIINFAGQKNPTFMQLMGGVTLGDTTNGAAVEVRRAADGETKKVTLTPKQQQGELAKIGVSPMPSLTLADEFPTEKHSPAAAARLIVASRSELKQGKPKFEGGDMIVRGRRITRQKLSRIRRDPGCAADKPLEITVDRPMRKSAATVWTTEVRRSDVRGAAAAAARFWNRDEDGADCGRSAEFAGGRRRLESGRRDRVGRRQEGGRSGWLDAGYVAGFDAAGRGRKRGS